MTVQEFNKAVDLYSDNVYRFILKNLKDRDKSKDIIQDTYEKLWINREKVDNSKVKSYLFTTAYHTMIDFIRREKKIFFTDNSMEFKNYDTNSFTDVKEVINEAVSKLPEDQRSVIMLRDYEGYSYEEIGQITGLSESQVKVYIYRARMFLKSYIGKLETVI